jgi:hypothetical protein
VIVLTAATCVVVNVAVGVVVGLAAELTRSYVMRRLGDSGKAEG